MEPREEIRNFIRETFMFGAEPSALADDASLLEGRIIDSTGVMELVAFLEDTFGIEVLDRDLVEDNLDSVDRLCDFLAAKGAYSRPPT